MVIFAVALVGLLSYRYLSLTAREGRDILQILSAQDIETITIEPARFDQPSLVSQAVVVRDKTTISKIAAALSNLPDHSPNHPKVTRAVTIRIQLKNKTIGGYLEEASNDGITFYYMSDVSSGWCFGTFLVPRDRGVFNVIADAIKAPRV